MHYVDESDAVRGWNFSEMEMPSNNRGPPGDMLEQRKICLGFSVVFSVWPRVRDDPPGALNLWANEPGPRFPPSTTIFRCLLTLFAEGPACYRIFSSTLFFFA